jgi:hypothetical protein
MPGCAASAQAARALRIPPHAKIARERVVGRHVTGTAKGRAGCVKRAGSTLMMRARVALLEYLLCIVSHLYHIFLRANRIAEARPPQDWGRFLSLWNTGSCSR